MLVGEVEEQAGCAMAQALQCPIVGCKFFLHEVLLHHGPPRLGSKAGIVLWS